MDKREQANRLIGKISELTGADILTFDDKDECVVTFDERLVAIFNLDLEETSSISLHVILGGMSSDENGGKLAQELLAGNYGWGLTGGGTIGLDEETGVITLGCMIPLGMNEDVFVDTVTRILGAADYWYKRIGLANEESGAGVEIAQDGVVRA